MTTRNTYTAEFKRQAIELAAREDVGPSRAGGFPRSGSFDPDATGAGNPAASQRS